jgi:hypothetical protein
MRRMTRMPNAARTIPAPTAAATSQKFVENARNMGWFIDGPIPPAATAAAAGPKLNGIILTTLLRRCRAVTIDGRPF